ncbi:thiamine biosynthesis protein ThiF [Saccharothrix violaceirubra]|uniref:Bacteriocin biosynthesis cyclodehydratase domain-containing protein n=1 Tax=Saccharothrix violaceirubra TaxID=413306 RepID=A0A7W7T7Y0_9PSEU|nr:thiamine biosynthesis protein ThiF [Saccharothrix violaceirubra]MBB4968213.1 hypothetical protein [Saccharothrix violaceirubra]
MDLPDRPRALPGLPLLKRHRDVVQIGVDGRHAVIVEQLPPPLVEALLGLRGRHTLAELRARLPHHADDLVGVLRGLVEAGLVDETVPQDGRLTAETTAWALRTRRSARHVPEARAKRCVAVRGDGRLAVAVAAQLAAAGVGFVRVRAEGRVGAEDTGCGYLDADVGRPRAEAAADAVRRARETVRRGSGAPDLVILTDALAYGPEVAWPLMKARTPHLVVRAREGLGVVGPLVVPGRSSCLRCADLHKGDVDDGWPMIAAQLADLPQHADLATTTATAGCAVAQALQALDHGDAAIARPPTWDATLEVDAFAGSVLHRIAPVHPRCDCRSLA